jgi:hypothetical protein
MAILLASCLRMRRVSAELALYSLLAVLIALNGRWVSWPRLALPAFPILAFWAMRTTAGVASRSPRRSGRAS